ncbi:hypothetical protein PHLGIDRAFT_118481 [Phlebiopsis gigantea 11061_1 CR5-6]|uniref:Uncharacterized protein n=1 Tax=Phlebiopsis gigantea (strain 11061_1 CR5-6) TaxID=745531 RepID=A0A0C3SAE0_PHLG1|nr:hypothetical protein PHLGIDRAFT_118481 [Phlebiopsis gigantea 11061_1 CR5-6]
MDIDVPPDRSLHVNDLPPELLYAVFVLLCPPRTFFGAVGDKRDLCAVVLVCHHWRDVALALLFSDVSFGVAEFTDSTVWKGRLAREPLDKRRILNQEGREIAVHGLVTVHGFLKRKPFICHSIRRLTLHRALHHFPPWDISLVKTDVVLGREILNFLPHLEELVISRMVVIPPSSPAFQDILPPKKSLQRLLVDYGPAFAEGNHRNCEEHTAHLIGCFTGLREITIDGYHGTTLPAPGAPALVFPPHLHRLEMRNVHARPALLADLRQSPAMATLQHLVWETDAAPPRAEQQGVQALLATLGPRLLSFACSVAAEASDGTSAPPPASAR